MIEKIKKVLASKYFIFFVAFMIMFIYLLPISSLLSSSGDSRETWKVIETFFSSDKYNSYVMYKGLYAFIPGVICYQIGSFLSVSSMLLLKIMHSFCFAYITTIGLPYLINYFFNNKIKSWQKYLLIICFYILENNLFIFISVDFFSLSLLLLCINSLIKISNNENIKYIYYLYSGIILGMCSCLSGQYLPSAIILILYGIYIICKVNRKIPKKLVIILLVFIAGIFVSKGLDKIYTHNVVDVARKNGAWIPSGETWLKVGFTSNMQYINYPYVLPDNLGKTIIKNEKMNNEIIAAGGYIYEENEMINIILHYPVLFITRWCERLFLGVMNDPFNNYPGKPFFSEILTVIIYGTLLFIFLLSLKDDYKKVRDLFSFKSLIVLSFLFSALTPSIGHVENRYYFGMRSFIISVFCLSPFLPNIIKKVKKIRVKDMLNYKINYNLIMYFIFIIMVVLLYAAIYQSAGPNTKITYEIFK